jgi:hypothetical protein
MSSVKQVRLFIVIYVSPKMELLKSIGFNYHFDALQVDKKPNELNQVFSELFHSPQSSRYATLRIQQAMVPILRLVVWTLDFYIGKECAFSNGS